MKTRWQVLVWVLMVASLCVGVGVSLAEARPKAPARSRNVDFEGDLIEGVNKRPLDSLNQLADGGGKDAKSHLYRKRKSFRSESRDTVREIGAAR